MDRETRQKIGSKGGKAKNKNKGFGSNPKLAKAVAKKGGMISRRGVDFATHERNLLNLFQTRSIDDWANIFWVKEPQFRYDFDEFGNEHLEIESFENLMREIAELQTDEYVDDYEKNNVPISNKLAQRIEDFVYRYLEQYEVDIRDKILEDEKDYLICRRDEEYDYNNAVGGYNG